MAQPKPNKRRSERIQVQLPVVWVRRGRRDELQTADISHEGMFLKSDEQLDPGQLMHLEVNLPNEKPLLIFATTRFCGRSMAGPGIGVQIYVISDHDRRRWLSFYRAMLRERSRLGEQSSLAAAGA